ncbi:hypothetical protein [Natronospora cellulosivora (SeqCode)]
MNISLNLDRNVLIEDIVLNINPGEVVCYDPIIDLPPIRCSNHWISRTININPEYEVDLLVVRFPLIESGVVELYDINGNSILRESGSGNKRYELNGEYISRISISGTVSASTSVTLYEKGYVIEDNDS